MHGLSKRQDPQQQGNEIMTITAKQLHDIGADITRGYIKAYRAFPVVGDVTEFDTVDECWAYVVKQFIKFSAA
jgi:hypothetical protein